MIRFPNTKLISKFSNPYYQHVEDNRIYPISNFLNRIIKKKKKKKPNKIFSFQENFVPVKVESEPIGLSKYLKSKQNITTNSARERVFSDLNPIAEESEYALNQQIDPIPEKTNELLNSAFIHDKNKNISHLTSLLTRLKNEQSTKNTKNSFSKLSSNLEDSRLRDQKINRLSNILVNIKGKKELDFKKSGFSELSNVSSSSLNTQKLHNSLSDLSDIFNEIEWQPLNNDSQFNTRKNSISNISDIPNVSDGDNSMIAESKNIVPNLQEKILKDVYVPYDPNLNFQQDRHNKLKNKSLTLQEHLNNLEAEKSVLNKTHYDLDQVYPKYEPRISTLLNTARKHPGYLSQTAEYMQSPVGSELARIFKEVNQANEKRTATSKSLSKLENEQQKLIGKKQKNDKKLESPIPSLNEYLNNLEAKKSVLNKIHYDSDQVYPKYEPRILTLLNTARKHPGYLSQTAEYMQSPVGSELARIFQEVNNAGEKKNATLKSLSKLKNKINELL